MKLKFRESVHSMDIILEPENKAELAQLLRFANNAAKVPPSINLSFTSDEAICNIYMPKIKPIRQVNTISSIRKGGQLR